MTGQIQSVDTLDEQALRAFAERLQHEPAGEAAILSLTASGDPAARERGFLPGLRAALDAARQPVPPNRHHSWGDWPHDLFAALQPHIPALEAVGICVVAWPDGRREAIATEVPLLATSYYLTQPVTFPLAAAAQALMPIVAVELHRSHAKLRRFSGQKETSAGLVDAPERGRHPKTGTQGQEHAERYDFEADARHLATVAEAVRADPDARAIVVAGVETLRKQFVRELGDRLPVGEINFDPGRSAASAATEIVAAANAALNTRWVAQASAVVAGGRAITDWATVVSEASEGRLHEVWMDPSAALHRYRCGGCPNIADGPGACGSCGAEPWNRLPLPELVVRHAARTGAQLHFVVLSNITEVAPTGVVALSRY